MCGGCGKEFHVWCLSHPASMRGEIGTKRCFGLKSKRPFIIARFQSNMQSLCRMFECTCEFEWPNWMPEEIGTKNFIVLKCKVPFVFPRFQPNLDWFSSMRTEFYVWSMSHPAAMRCEIGAKNCLALKGKVPFVSARFASNVQWLCSMRREWHLWCLSHPAAMLGERDENSFGLKSKLPSLTGRFSPNLLSRIWRVCHIWCSSRHAAMRGKIRTKNCFGLKSKVPFVTDRFWPNLHMLWHMWRECNIWCLQHRCLQHRAAMRGEIGKQNCFGFKSNVPFVTAQFRPIFQWLWWVERESRIWRLSAPLPCEARPSAACDVWVTPLQMRQDREGKLFRSRK
jgi:hypothetical protein